jgi:slit protein 2
MLPFRIFMNGDENPRLHCLRFNAGFEGKKCEKLSSISLQEKDAYVSLPPLSHRPRANVTLVLSTRQQQGVILYHGVDEHLAVELFRGRLRISYNIGNYPVSTMFSYEQLSDGE